MNLYETLNDKQKEAVLCTEGPLLILAGAGSGKTRVLTHRIAYLIDEKGVNPWNILAITFTNKAANEMRERIDSLVGFGSESIWVSTFHSACVRILRRHIDRLGYDNSFTIYDADDQKTLVKAIIRRMDLDPKLYSEKGVIARISGAKEKMISPTEMEREAGDFRERKIAEIYGAYEEELEKNNALDFDDLLVKTVKLFNQCQDVLEHYQNRFKYIHVDEYQDTNMVQFEFIRLLSDRYQNLCVVGDDDQSIYRFRGADIRNILGFENTYPDARVIRLEQNYRSTENILNAANHVISNNMGRKRKTLWTEKGQGSKIHLRQFMTGYEEAEYIIGEIARGRQRGEFKCGDCAVLYRTNAQSRIFEEKCLFNNIPYKIVGGVNFYSRKEIKDILAYLKTIDNSRDDLAVKRILNVPKRGIGASSVNKAEAYALRMDISFYDAIRVAEEIPSIGRAAKKLDGFVTLIQTLKSKADHMSIKELIEEVLETTGYAEELRLEATTESQSRLENLDELITKAQSYQEAMEERGIQASLSGFLEEVALVADIDSVEDGQDYVLLMTLHGAKGLEFPRVFIAGMEDGMFPSYMSINSDSPDDIEEERRLCYVGITRAKEDLTLTAVKQRMIRGELQFNRLSRFVKEIPRSLLDTGEVASESGSQYKSSAPRNNIYSQIKSGINSGRISSSAASSSKTFNPDAFKVTKASSLDYTVGDRVMHIKFGVGIVKDITDTARDYQVTVDFDRAGTKKMFAAFAKLKKI